MKRLLILTLCCMAIQFAHAQHFSIAYGRSETAILGVESNSVSKEKAKALGFDNPHGRYLTKVVKNSAAEKAGLQPFDYVYAFDKYELSEEDELKDVLENYKPGDKAIVHFVRSGKKLTTEVNFPKNASTEKAYLGVSPHSDEDDKMGVKVNITENSTASAMGLQDGDVILSINNIPMVDWNDISVAVNQLTAGDKITLEYERNGKKMRAEQAIQSQSERQNAALERQNAAIASSNWNPDQSAFLGVHSNDVSEEKAKKLGFDNAHGSYVSRVIGNTAAEKAGLKPFDYVYGINDYRTNEDVSLSEILKRFKPEDKATVHFIRNGEQKTATLNFLKRSDAKNTISDDKCETPFLGLQHQDDASEGVAVDVVEKSTALEMGLKNGDVLTKVNGHRIVDWDDVTIAVDNMKVGETVTVEYMRDGKKQTASKPIKSYCETRPNESRQDYRFEWNNGGAASADERDEERVTNLDIANTAVAMENMNAEDAANLKNSFGIEMPVANDLKIERVNVVANPNMGAFQLQFNLPQTGETSIRIYNSAGRMIYNYDLGNFSGDFTDQVNISQNGAGSYFLEIRQSGKSVTKKVVLQTK